MTLTWYGHSCFKIDDGVTSVVFDPYKPGSVPGLALPPLKADCCVCSHGHNDHCYPEGVELTGREACVEQVRFPTFHDDSGGSIRGENICTVIEIGGMRFLHMGDIGHPLTPSRCKQFGRVDVLMVPVGGHYTIDAAIAKQMKDILDPYITVPMHYRGRGFGYENIATLDKFTGLCNDVVYFDTNSIELEKVTRKCTAVLKCPVKG